MSGSDSTATDANAAATGERPSVNSGQAARAAKPVSEAEARAGNRGLDGTLGAYYPSMSGLDFEITDDAARNILDECSKFLLQLAYITSGVLATVDVSAVRKIVAENSPLPGCSAELSGAEQAPDRDHRKNPRGRKHPLLTLVQMALQGVRMLLQITAAAHPNVLGKESLEQKKARKELKEQERAWDGILKGKV